MLEKTLTSFERDITTLISFEHDRKNSNLFCTSNSEPSTSGWLSGRKLCSCSSRSRRSAGDESHRREPPRRRQGRSCHRQSSLRQCTPPININRNIRLQLIPPMYISIISEESNCMAGLHFNKIRPKKKRLCTQ